MGMRLVLLLLCWAPFVQASLDNIIVPIFGFLPSIIVNLFFGSLLNPVVDELCLDFVKQFSLQESAVCTCTGGINANLQFTGKGECTINDNQCVGSLCGTGIIYPKVTTERVDFITALFGDPSDAVDAFDLSAVAVLADRLTVSFEAKGSVAQCTVEIESVDAELDEASCDITTVPFMVADPSSCEQNTESEKFFDIDCGGGVDGIIDIAFLDKS